MDAATLGVAIGLIKKIPRGDPGKTPVRGIDYWTETDKEEILADVASLIETKADKAYMVTLFEELKEAILAGDTDKVIALLDQAILDYSILA